MFSTIRQRLVSAGLALSLLAGVFAGGPALSVSASEKVPSVAKTMELTAKGDCSRNYVYLDWTDGVHAGYKKDGKAWDGYTVMTKDRVLGKTTKTNYCVMNPKKGERYVVVSTHDGKPTEQSVSVLNPGTAHKAGEVYYAKHGTKCGRKQHRKTVYCENFDRCGKVISVSEEYCKGKKVIGYTRSAKKHRAIRLCEKCGFTCKDKKAYNHKFKTKKIHGKTYKVCKTCSYKKRVKK